MTDFVSFHKIARLSRDIVITEKIDGTNGVIYNGEGGEFLVGSRNQWITPGKNTDNHGFAAWAYEHKEELQSLGAGYHFGEWWGRGIQRGYGLKEKKFSLFNTGRWHKGSPQFWYDGRVFETILAPECCDVVPVLYTGLFDTAAVDDALLSLVLNGSVAAPGFTDPEGVVVYHTASGQMFKKTIKNDSKPKSTVQ